MEITNGFSKGIVKDLAELLRDPQSYDDALDIRLNSNNGASDHIVVNIKGNSLKLTVPEVPSILTIDYTANSIITPWSITPIITTTSNTYTGSVITGTSTNLLTVFEEIKQSLSTDAAFTSLQLNIAISGTRVRVWSDVEDIVSFGASPYLTTSVQARQTGNLIIGWENIDDDIYLLTTNDTSLTGGIGTVFKVTYDNLTLTLQTTLIYSAELNFTTQFPVANPGGIEGIKETSDIIRIYWTDRLNDLRSMNVANVNIMAVSPSDLSILTGTELRKPTLKNVGNGGVLLSGHYQVAYRLKTLGGSATPPSVASNSIVINDGSLSEGYGDYEGSEVGVITSRSITIEFPNVDTSYPFLEVIVLRKETPNGNVFIDKVVEIPVTSSTVTYTYTGNEPAVTILEQIFTDLSQLFSKCHTIAQRDNILFAGNTRTEPFNVEFDTRAYRFNPSQDVALVDESNTPLGYSASDALSTTFIIPETSDAINPDQDTYKYQSDGITLGGEGPYVKYEFVTKPLLVDARTNQSYVYPYRLPWLLGNNDINLGDDTIYQEDGYYSDMKSPFISHIFRGYRRGETYRFSLVPIKNSRKGYAKWIGDIQMPDVFENYQPFDTIPNSEAQGDSFPLTTEIGGKWHVNSLGVKFTVTVPPYLLDQMDSYTIERVKLEPEQRTVIAQGFIHKSFIDTSHIPYTYHPIGGVDGGTGNLTLNSKIVTPSISTNTLSAPRIFSFHSPDLLFGHPIDHKVGDRIKVIQGIKGSASALSANVTQPAHNNEAIKLYKTVPILVGNSRYFDVTHANSIGQDEEILIDGLNYENRTPFVSSINGRRGRGTDTTVIVISGMLPNIVSSNVFGSGENFTSTGVLGANPNNPNHRADKMVANYIRSNIGQYGGKGYSARSQNTYIGTGCHVIIDDNDPTDTIDVYGGDTFINIFDTFKITKNYDNNELSGHREERIAVGIWYPVESFVNTDLRHGFTLNGRQNSIGYFHSDLNPIGPAPDPDDFQLDYGEDFLYNYTYSEEMDTQRSFPLPLNTVEVTEHPVRIWASGGKVYGELADSWTQFDNERYIDIQGDLGEIRQLVNVNEQLAVWQKRGMGIASVNERSVINDASGNGIILGQSGVLPRFDYISQSIGSWHQFGFAKGPNSVIFFDMKDGGLYLYSSEGLKDISEGKIKSWLYENTRRDILNNDSPVAGTLFNAGMCATYDQRNKEYIITFHDTDIVGILRFPRAFTWAYDPRYDRFSSRRSYTPKMYINDGEYVFSTDPSDLNKMYMHDVGDRGVFYNQSPTTSSITIIPNANPNFSKVFDNTRWYSEVYEPNGNELSTETFNDVTTFTPYQTTGVRTDIKRLLREWKFTVLYEQNTKNRIRNHYCKQRFNYLNNNNKEFKLYYITNNYRVFPK